MHFKYFLHNADASLWQKPCVLNQPKNFMEKDRVERGQCMHVMMCISLVGMASPVSEILVLFVLLNHSHTHISSSVYAGHSTNYVLCISLMTIKLSIG